MTFTSSGLPIAQCANSVDQIEQILGVSPLWILSQIEFEPLTDVVLLVGSLAEGYANALSDIDIYIIGDNNLHRDPARLFWLEAGRWVDVSYFKAEFLDRAITQATLGSKSTVSDWGCRSVLNVAIADIFHRILTSLPLTCPVAPKFDVGEICQTGFKQKVATTFIVQIGRAHV